MKHFITLGTVLLLATAQAFAQSDMDMGQIEMEQLQAQVDVMLEEVNELQHYRICAEKGKIYNPQLGGGSDEDGCTLPQSLSPPATANLGEQAPVNSSRPTPNEQLKQEMAPSAKTFRLPRAEELSEDFSLNNLSQESQQTQNTAVQSEGDSVLGYIPTNYPNERVKNLIETAVDQALTGKDYQSQSFLTQTTAPEEQQTSSPKKREGNAAPAQQNYQQQHKQAIQNLVPSCQEGEFLTTVNGNVVCQRAESTGKMACPPKTLRVYLSRLDRHLHYFVSYTPHGQEQSETEANHKITVSCQNGNYRLKTVTRHECGGRQCHPSKKPAYSQTFYCQQDNTGRCYARENGRLVNHSFMEAAISKQY